MWDKNFGLNDAAVCEKLNVYKIIYVLLNAVLNFLKLPKI